MTKNPLSPTRRPRRAPAAPFLRGRGRPRDCKRHAAAVKVAQLLAAAILALLTGCRGGDAPDRITIFAASSLTQAFEGLADGYEAAYPGSEVRLQFGGSSLLATQILEGARADLFASANALQVARLVDAELAAAPSYPIARNELILIVPDGNPAGIDGVGALARPGLRLISAPEEVPIGRYTRELLRAAAAADSSLPVGFSEAVLSNVISFEPNVRQMVTRIELGEADGAIVYRTDTLSPGGGRVETIELPTGLNVEPTYFLLPLSLGEETRRFQRYLASEDGQRVLRRWGFEAP